MTDARGSKTTYGNGAYIRYTYDSQDRLLLSYYKDSSGTEQKLNGYVYDRMGNLSQVTDHVSGKTYDLDYDLLDRLMRVRDNEGNYYEYTYDASNNMTRIYHGQVPPVSPLLILMIKTAVRQRQKLRRIITAPLPTTAWAG